MVWIVKTKDGITHDVKDEVIGMFTQQNEVAECQLKR